MRAAWVFACAMWRSMGVLQRHRRAYKRAERALWRVFSGNVSVRKGTMAQHEANVTGYGEPAKMKDPETGGDIVVDWEKRDPVNEPKEWARIVNPGDSNVISITTYDAGWRVTQIDDPRAEQRKVTQKRQARRVRTIGHRATHRI